MHGMLKAAVVAAGLAGLGAGVAGEAAAVPYFATTGQSTGNTQIDSAHASTWLFAMGAGATLELGGGNFTIKRGNQTSLPISLSVYLGADATGVLLQSVSVAASAVTQSYAPVEFAFATPVNLVGGVGGTNYFMALTSATGTTGNKQYFIKGQEETVLAFEATGGQTGGVGPGGIGPGGPAVVPEPMTAALLGAGLIGLGLVRRRGRRSAAQNVD